MEDKSLVGDILEAGGSVTISGRKDTPLSERINATFNGRLPQNADLIRSVLKSGGTVTIRPQKPF